MALNWASDSEIHMDRMQASDLDLVMVVEKDAYAIPWTRQNFVDCLKSNYECWVVHFSQDQIGHGVLSFGAGEAHLLNLTITPPQQGSGYGRQGLDFFLERAKLVGADTVFLEVRESNNKAFELYSSVGFNEIGRRVGYYPGLKRREDALIMAIDL